MILYIFHHLLFLLLQFPLRVPVKDQIEVSSARNASLRVKGDTFSLVCLIEMLMFAQVISVTVRVIGSDGGVRVFLPVSGLFPLGNTSS